ncbi:hydrocephalus-inducing protein-like [Lathamus discolor]|uniref:hydrocephalus-inducing protein-like n=1 Tax=Lathamus discolor TaxID=678569 RepID=UPI0032B8662A
MCSCPSRGGPTFQVHLRAIVAEPSLCLSRDRLEFSSVQCGQWQEETIQLHNTSQVPCKWSMSMNEAVKEVDKHLPASEHDKLWEEMRPAPCGFEVLPSGGTLAPGQQCHVQVRFSPTEEKCYRGELQIQICQSSQRLRVPVLGCGLQPRLELSPAELELGPLLPQSHGEEGTVVGSLVSLDQDQLSFGAVVRQSYTCRRVVMRNAGNTGVRFLVVIDMLKPENLESSSVLQGCSYIDVTFLNETTGEYLFHMVTFKVMASGPIGTVEMSTAVRQRVSSTVKVDNPLPVPVTFAINCKVPDTDCADFQTAKSISAAPASAGGSELNVEGPFLIPAGGTTSISFRNVFPRATAFQYAVKHPAFSVRAPEMLRAKSSTTITVSFTGGPAPVTSRLTTRQRLASPREMRRPRATQLRDMGEVSLQKFSAVGLDQRLFQPFPSEVVFENYVPRQFYIAALALRNIDRVPRLLNVILGNSPYFELISPSNEDYKVAPGMSSTYRILFRPDEDKDYFDELIIITEREKFFVPIRAIGARASLDFPEQLNFSECPVRFSTQKTLLVRNVGKREACYSITTLSPFSVDPSIGTLGVGEAMEVTVEFHPPKTGVYTSPMIVHYDTGEDVHKSLCGTAVNVNIKLDKSSLTVEKTSVTLSNLRSLVIHNQSAITAHFQWKRLVDQEEEERQKLRFVTLCSNTVKRYKLALVVDVDGVGREVLSLPENKDAAAVWYSSPEPRGIIQPHSSVEIPFTLEVQVTGKQDTVARVAVFGSKESPLEIHLLSTGEGPVVHVHPSEINFGSIQVLQDASRTLHLSNQSVIPASFSAKMAGADSCWTVGPSQGVIPAKAEVSLAVTANLDDTEQFKDEVVLFIENSRAYVIPVQAVGVGTTIVIDKPFGPELNLAPCFSSLDPCCYRFKMTNKGRRTHLLYWTTEGGTTLKQRKRLPRISKSKGKVSSCGPVLKLQPLRTELMPGQTAEVVLKGSCSTPQVVKEKLLCHAIVGKEGVKNLIVQVDVTCEFIAPALQISSREITFRVEKHPGDVLAVMYKPLSVKNMCSLPLSVVLALEQPFSICTADQQPLPADAQPMKLRTGEELQLCIGFNPAYEEDLLIRAAEKALKIKFLEHPHEEQVTVRGEVYFPNLQIQTTAVDFGCILNDTKDVRYMEMTNCSPLVVQYHWAFLKDSQVNPVRFMETEPLALGVEEVFDILPLHGELQPGQSQRVCFSFFGHANTVSQVTALCRVEGGPSYEVALRGEASRISYLLDTTEIDCGLQVFNKVTEAAVTLQNSGKLGFAFAVLSPGTGTAASPLPGVPLVVPSRGYVEPGKQQVLKVYYLPGVPGVFCRAFQIQLGHLEPEKISLKGEGTFPRIHLDLPRNIKGNAKYEKILLKAKEKLDKGSQREEAIALGEAVAAEPRVDDSGTVWDAQLQMQMEEMLIEEHALEQQKALASRPPEDTAFHQRVHRRLLKAELPEYVLDLGYVVPGDIHTHMVKLTNTGHFPASFKADGYVLYNTGFSVCLDLVKRLPSCETKTFEVCFDPQSANVPLGKVDVLLPIKVRGGPTFQVRLRAIVAEPSLCLSRDRLEFSSVQCGQWQEETIQLHNTSQVPCKWSMSMNEAVKEVDKHLPASEHDKLREEMRPAPCGFEVLPSGGTLAPGQQCHVQVRFSPTEEKCYRGELQIQICQSSQRLRVPVLGCGLQPRLELSPAELELGPLLPQSHGEEGTVVGSLVSLDQDQLSFGAVVRQSYTCRRVVMRNAGNTGVSCNVREKQSQTILLSNPSSEAWTLKPIVEGKYWKGPEFIHLEARQKEKAYQVTYRPLTMSCGNKKHQDGYPMGVLPVDLHCVLLTRRFLVVIDMLKPENLESSSVLQGCSYIDVTFLNETTGEYLFHMVTFKVMASGPIGTVEMSTAVRQRVSSTVKVDNPLPVPVTFAINCKVPDVSVPQHFTVPAQSKGSFLIPAGGTTSISFRNVFPRATAFQYAVKHPAFSVRAPEMLRAKSSTTITVSFTGGPAPVTSSPFSVDPSIGTLGVGEAMEVTVEFHPPKTGVYTSPMIVHYDTDQLRLSQWLPLWKASTKAEAMSAFVG